MSQDEVAGRGAGLDTGPDRRTDLVHQQRPVRHHGSLSLKTPSDWAFKEPTWATRRRPAVDVGQPRLEIHNARPKEREAREALAYQIAVELGHRSDAVVMPATHPASPCQRPRRPSRKFDRRISSPT
jgi:hypothetical protein